jgi:hypothetical protein
MNGTVVVKHEACRDSGEAYEKSNEWRRLVSHQPRP